MFDNDQFAIADQTVAAVDDLSRSSLPARLRDLAGRWTKRVALREKCYGLWQETTYEGYGAGGVLGLDVGSEDSVEQGLAQAREALGPLDIVVNNAGILRDKSFKNMTDADWDIIFRVHNYGAYKVTKAAWPIMTEQGYGRVLFTTSSAGPEDQSAMSTRPAVTPTPASICPCRSMICCSSFSQPARVALAARHALRRGVVAGKGA